MSSHARSTREEDRRLSIRTLIIASVASATAAIVTSLFWVRGTPIAAALTPVIVALVSELLHRPTERIAERLTTETAALSRETDVLPEAAGAGPPPPREEHDPRPAREAPAREPGRSGEPEYRVYRSAPAGPSRDIPWRAILVTAAAAFLIAAAALTLPELIAGQSVGGGDRNFTLFGGEPEQEKTPVEETETERETPPDGQVTEPRETVPQLEPTPEQTETQPEAETETETTPQPQTESAPAP